MGTADQYEVTDLAPGAHQFRLRQVDTDGTGHLSNATSVTVRMEEAVRLMANGKPRTERMVVVR